MLEKAAINSGQLSYVRMHFCLLNRDFCSFFCAKMNKQKETKPGKKFLCDWLLPPVSRFIVPSRISRGELRKTCCFSVCIRSRQTPSFRQTPGPMPWCSVLCMDQSDGPTQPGIDDRCMTFGFRAHHREGGIYLSFILMVWWFFYLSSFCFCFFTAFLRLFIHWWLAVTRHGLAPLLKLRCKINKCVLLDLNMFFSNLRDYKCLLAFPRWNEYCTRRLIFQVLISLSCRSLTFLRIQKDKTLKNICI